MKIITSNIADYNAHPCWCERASEIAAELIRHDPDVVAIQKVRFDPTQEQTRKNFQDMAGALSVRPSWTLSDLG